MLIAERVENIEKIATILADRPAQSTWAVELGNLVLTIDAGAKQWAASARSEPRDAAEDKCTAYLLRKMAYAAGVCPRCIGPVTRLPLDPRTNKTPPKHYRCPSCLHSWADS